MEESEMRAYIWELNVKGNDRSKVSINPLNSKENRDRRPMRNRAQKTQLVLDTLEKGPILEKDLISICREHDINADEVISILNDLRSQNLIYSPKYGYIAKIK